MMVKYNFIFKKYKYILLVIFILILLFFIYKQNNRIAFYESNINGTYIHESSDSDDSKYIVISNDEVSIYEPYGEIQKYQIIERNKNDISVFLDNKNYIIQKDVIENNIYIKLISFDSESKYFNIMYFGKIDDGSVYISVKK